ncbi:MAG: peptidase dimerization domain-containing protein [Spirochaetia bacterium]|jgi:amidohydrolase|nr:peptidase dimerization domain-containing protein [Spirochaetia bacterium]
MKNQQPAFIPGIDKQGLFELAARLKVLPEPGFFEFETKKALVEFFGSLGGGTEAAGPAGGLTGLGDAASARVRIIDGLARTAVVAELGDPEAPAVILLADIDALPTPEAPGGMAHSCGHYAQAAVMASVFKALARSGLVERSGMRLLFVGAPAEEYVELSRRMELKKAGELRFLSGKQELIYRGIFDKPCLVLKYHSMEDAPARELTVNGRLGGFIAKRAEFFGKPAHAGAHPEDGTNALSAASLALQAIHAQRDSFKDEDHVKIHPILSEGGSVVNIVPAKAVIETYVRAWTQAALTDAALKVDRSFRAGALALGAALRITDTPGYQPFIPCPALGEVLGKAALEFEAPDRIDVADTSNASDDIGDVACLVPTGQLGCSGFTGSIHSKDFEPSDPSRAYLRPAEILLRTAQLLLDNEGAAARRIIKEFKPRFSKAEYLAAVESMFSIQDFSKE